MQPDNSSTVLQRKAKAARKEHDARAMTPAKALRLALELTGDALFKLAMSVRAVEQRALAHADLRGEVARAGAPLGTAKAPDGGAEADTARDPAELSGPIMLLLDGPGGARGAVMVDRALVQALIEVQTMGKVSAQQPPERPFTPTDAAVCAPLLDALFVSFADKIEEVQQGAGPAVGYRFGDRVEDARALGLALEAKEFELFALDVNVARGLKSGGLTLILPAPILPPLPVVEGDEDTNADARFDLAALAMSAPVTLNAVLDWVEMPLNEICALKPGAIIPISGQALGKTDLVASQGHVVGKVRLGQMNGFRAVRFSHGPIRAGVQAEPGGTEVSSKAAPSVAGPVTLNSVALDANPDLSALSMSDGLGGPTMSVQGLSETSPGPQGLPDLENTGFEPDESAPAALPDLPGLPSL